MEARKFDSSKIFFNCLHREVGETGGFEYVDNSHPSDEMSAKMTLHTLKKFTTYQIVVQVYRLPSS
jgi:hypothetical protein